MRYTSTKDPAPICVLNPTLLIDTDTTRHIKMSPCHITPGNARIFEEELAKR